MLRINPLKSIYTVIILVLIVSCVKENRCVRQNEKQKHIIKPAEIGVQELEDTLAKYENLTLSRFIDNEMVTGMHCNIYYQDYLLFTQKYRLFKSKNTGDLITWDSIPKYIDIDLQANVSRKEAILIARDLEDFGMQCIRCELGIADASYYSNLPDKSYRMVWKIEGWSESPNVMIDANTDVVYYHYSD
ncbi:MAG: hypothetical protein ACI8ZM_003121 [Crocinitomix sp.]|jgi:hypothetical protein